MNSWLSFIFVCQVFHRLVTYTHVPFIIFFLFYGLYSQYYHNAPLVLVSQKNRILTPKVLLIILVIVIYINVVIFASLLNGI